MYPYHHPTANWALVTFTQHGPEPFMPSAWQVELYRRAYIFARASTKAAKRRRRIIADGTRQAARN
jgi:hypothetical protein